MILIALVGHVISYKKLQNRILLALAIISASLFFVALYLIVSEILAYIALTGLVAATIWMIVESRHYDSCVNSAV